MVLECRLMVLKEMSTSHHSVCGRLLLNLQPETVAGMVPIYTTTLFNLHLTAGCGCAQPLLLPHLSASVIRFNAQVGLAVKPFCARSSQRTRVMSTIFSVLSHLCGGRLRSFSPVGRGAGLEHDNVVRRQTFGPIISHTRNVRKGSSETIPCA